jgi:hypothetical protein
MTTNFNGYQRFLIFLFALLIDAAIIKYVFTPSHGLPDWLKIFTILFVYADINIMFRWTFRNFVKWLRLMRYERRTHTGRQ